MNETRFATRTVRGGRVKIGGAWFRPSEQWLAYDGRLDGLRYVFGRYHSPAFDKSCPYARQGFCGFVFLWGPEANYHNSINEWIVGPDVVEDSSGKWLPWIWWHAER